MLTAEKCGHCTKVVTDRDKGLQCELCEGWFHAACQDVSDEDYKILSKLEACHWFCKTCNVSVHKVINSVARLQKRLDKIEEGFQELRNDLSSKVDRQFRELESVKKDLQHLGEIIQVKQTNDDREVVSRTEMQNVLDELEKKCVDNAEIAVTEDIHDVQQAVEETRKKAADELNREARTNNILYTEPQKAEVQFLKIGLKMIKNL